MKKISFLLMAICLLGVFSLSAQKPVRNFLSINGSLAYTGQARFQSHYDFKSFMGGSDNIGISYQLYANHFTFSLGTEFGLSTITNYSNETIIIGKKEIPKGTLELLGNGHVSIPTLIGGEFGKFYFKVGVVPTFNILNAATIIGPIFNEENPKPYENTKKMLFRNPFQLYGRFEIGGSFGHFTPFEAPEQPKARFYLGGFVDFGITKDMPKVSRGSYAKGIPYAISDEGYQDVLHQLSVGLRFTCLVNCSK